MEYQRHILLKLTNFPKVVAFQNPRSSLLSLLIFKFPHFKIKPTKLTHRKWIEPNRPQNLAHPPPICSPGRRLLRRNLPLPSPVPPLAPTRYFTLFAMRILLGSSVLGQLGFEVFGLHSQPSDRISKVLQGGQLTDEEAESLMKK